MSISIQQISYIHPDKEVLFSDLNFAISKGQKLGLVGNNGCGNLLCYKLLPDSYHPLPVSLSARTTYIISRNISGNMIH